ncbi:MAG: NAD(P)/FAD-dependent oxidoreductase [Candidatus Thorarchaeota archaeon]
MKTRNCQIAIIGAGPAGSAAAIQLKRAGINPIVFEKNKIGGLAVNANLIENYIGFPQGIDGKKFVSLLDEHFNSLVIDLIEEEIIDIDFEDEKFILKSNQTICYSEYLIIATGTKSNPINIKGMNKLVEKNLLFYEPINIPLEKLHKQQIAILGGGDAAFDYALNLVQNNNKIAIVHRNEIYSCLPLLYHRAINIEAIKLLAPKTISELQIDDNSKVKIIFDDESHIIVDYILVAFGREPNNELLKNLSREILQNERLYQIGDLVNGNFRQISIATGNGLQCAMDIIRKINE